MPKIVKKLLIVAAGVIFALALVLLVVNLYLQSEGVQARIRLAAERALGSRIDVRGTMFTPWDGFVLKGIAVPNPEETGNNLLEAEQLKIHFAWWPLLTGKILIREVTLLRPVLIARQNTERQWVVLVPPPPVGEIPIEIPSEGTGAKGGKSFKVEVNAIRIQSASGVFIDTKGRAVLRFEDANLLARVAENKASEGTFQIGRIEISRLLHPTDLRGTFSWDGKVLCLPDIAGSLGGGTIAGQLLLNLIDDPSFELSLSVKDAQLQKLAEDAAVTPDGTTGFLQGRIDLAGSPQDSMALTGNATFELMEAKLRPPDFLVQVGTMFGIDELQLLKLSEANSHFTIADGEVKIDRIFLKSDNLILTGKGTAGFDGALDVDAALLANKKIQKQIKAVMSKNFQQSDDPEYKKLKFKITNTIQNPRTDLLDKLVGMKIGQDMGGLLQNIFGAPKPKDND